MINAALGEEEKWFVSGSQAAQQGEFVVLEKADENYRADDIKMNPWIFKNFLKTEQNTRSFY